MEGYLRGTINSLDIDHKGPYLAVTSPLRNHLREYYCVMGDKDAEFIADSFISHEKLPESDRVEKMRKKVTPANLLIRRSEIPIFNKSLESLKGYFFENSECFEFDMTRKGYIQPQEDKKDQGQEYDSATSKISNPEACSAQEDQKDQQKCVGTLKNVDDVVSVGAQKGEKGEVDRNTGNDVIVRGSDC